MDKKDKHQIKAKGEVVSIMPQIGYRKILGLLNHPLSESLLESVFSDKYDEPKKEKIKLKIIK